MKMKNRMKKHSLKYISVFMSIFLWVYVLNSEKVVFEKIVQLEYILPDDMMFAQRPQHEVVFIIQGPRAFVRTVADRDDRLVVDLNRANTRKQLAFHVDINPTQLSLPFGMVVQRVTPRRINIRLEKKASKIVPIKLQFAGELPNNLSLVRSELRPSEVEVHGPRSVIQDLKEIATRPVDWESLMGQEKIPVEILIPDERLTLSTSSEVGLHYQLRATSSNLMLKDIPIKFLTQSSVVSSSSKTVSLKLLVPERMIKNRSNISSSIQVWADIPEDFEGKSEVPLKVVLPPGIHLLEVFPKSIVVNVK